MLKISPVNFNNTFIAFRAKKIQKSPELKNDCFVKSDNLQILPLDLYFIRMEDYDVDINWAREMINLTYVISSMIRNNEDFEDIWQKIITGLQKINNSQIYGMVKSNKNGFFIKPYTYGGRGSEYHDKYIRKIKKAGGEFYAKANEEYKDALTTKIDGTHYVYISYGFGKMEDYLTLKSMVEREYEKLKSIEKPTDGQINSSVATIHWLIAQASPFMRGSDSFANVLTKSIYHAYGMNLTPIKEGKSFDFEAFYSDLEEYIKKYPRLFEIAPSRKKHIKKSKKT